MKTKLYQFQKAISTIIGYRFILVVSSSGIRWKKIFDSLILTSHKLTKLGFTYYNGKVAIIESSEEDLNV